LVALPRRIATAGDVDAMLHRWRPADGSRTGPRCRRHLAEPMSTTALGSPFPALVDRPSLLRRQY